MMSHSHFKRDRRNSDVDAVILLVAICLFAWCIAAAATVIIDKARKHTTHAVDPHRGK